MCAPHLPRHLQAAALIIACPTDEANAGWLDNLAYTVRARVANGALGKEAAALALFARVDKAADARYGLSARVLYGEHTACPVDTGLRGVQLRHVKGGVLVPNNRAHLGCEGGTTC